MYPGREFVGERLINKALPRHPALAFELGGDDRDGEMRLAFGPRPGMTGVTVRFIGYFEPNRSKPLSQLEADRIDDGHHCASGFRAAAAARKRPRLSTT